MYTHIKIRFCVCAHICDTYFHLPCELWAEVCCEFFQEAWDRFVGELLDQILVVVMGSACHRRGVGDSKRGSLSIGLEPRPSQQVPRDVHDMGPENQRRPLDMAR